MQGDEAVQTLQKQRDEISQLQMELDALRGEQRTVAIKEETQVIDPEQLKNYRPDRVVVPASTATINASSFQSWKTLREVVFAKGSQLKTIGDYAFSDSGLEEFVAPAPLKSLGQATFQSCTKLGIVKLNDGLETIGKDCLNAS